MSENKSRKQDNGDMDRAAQQIIDLVKDNFGNQVESLRSHVDTRILSLKTVVEEKSQAFGAKLDVCQEKTNKKLDDIDEALRGNGRIGLFEQVRSINRQLKIMWAVVILLFEFKLYGLTIEEWVSSWWKPKQNTQQVIHDTRSVVDGNKTYPQTKPTILLSPRNDSSRSDANTNIVKNDKPKSGG